MNDIELTETVALSSAEWESSEPLVYDVVGIVFEGELRIGLQAADRETIRTDVAPEGVYEAVAPLVRSRLALDSVRAATTESAGAHLGSCTVSRVDDETVELDVELFAEWFESEPGSGAKSGG